MEPVLSSGSSARFSDADMQSLARGCANNIFATTAGATASLYLPDCPDGNVAGVAMLAAERDAPETVEVSRLVLDVPMPLQSTLFVLSQGAAAAMAARRRSPMMPQALHVALAVLYDPVPRGSAESANLQDIDAGCHAVYVVEGQKSAWVFDRGRPPAELLAEAVKLADVTDRAAARVYRVGISCTDKAMAIARVPPPAPEAAPAEASPTAAAPAT
jgi:hypothetical protein